MKEIKNYVKSIEITDQSNNTHYLGLVVKEQHQVDIMNTYFKGVVKIKREGFNFNGEMLITISIRHTSEDYIAYVLSTDKDDNNKIVEYLENKSLTYLYIIHRGLDHLPTALTEPVLLTF